jgi:hypothetical protein
MRIKSKILLSVAFALGTTMLTAFPADAKWVRVAEDSNGSIYYYNDANIMQDYLGRRMYWQRFKMPYEIDGVLTLETKFLADCSLGSQRQLEIRGYNSNRKLVGRETKEGSTQYPKFYDAEVMQRICNF